MKIGIDIDDVVVEYVKHFLEFCKSDFGIEFSREQVVNYDLWELMNLSKKEFFEIVAEFNNKGHVEKQEFIEGAKESIEILSKDNELFFITSRPSEVEKATFNFLQKHFPKLTINLIHSEQQNNLEGSNKKTKAQICKELGIKLIIEDRRKYALECANEGIKVLLMDQLWNREMPQYRNIVRARNWEEIMEKLK